MPALAKLDKFRPLVEESGQRVDNFGPFLYCLTRKLSTGEKTNLRTRTGMKTAEAAAWMNLEHRAKAVQKLLTSKQAAQNSRLYKMLESQDPALAVFLLGFSPLQPVRERVKHYFTHLRPLVRDFDDKEVEALGAKPGTPKFAALREAHLAGKLDKAGRK